MDIFDDEIVRFFNELDKNNVQYILVGGYAINFHGYQRYTGDLDIWLKDSLENRKRLRAAFIACEMGDFPMIERMQFLPGWTEFHLNNSLTLDIMTEMKGLENYTFEQCLEIASVAELDGAKVPFLHINQLIINKKLVDRPKDRTDVIALEQIKQLKEQEQDRANGQTNDPEPPFLSR